MYKLTMILSLFLLLASGGCIQGSDEEQGLNFRTETMQWPNLIKGPEEPQGAKGNLEQ